MALRASIANAMKDETAKEMTERITRAVETLMRERGLTPIREFKLPCGRRVDVAAQYPDGTYCGVEVKASPRDFKRDDKWPEYLRALQHFYFAVDITFPKWLLPLRVGVILARKTEAIVVTRAGDQLVGSDDSTQPLA